MSAELPSFMRPSKAAKPLPSFVHNAVPDWMTAAPKRDPNLMSVVSKSHEGKSFLITQFELAFPRVIDRMYSGETLNRILEDFPIPVERGAFMKWVKKDSGRFATYTEAKETRTEIWTGEMLRVAMGEEGNIMELDRAKFLVETYKFLIKAENKKGYGDTKNIEVTGNISIVAALDAAQGRLSLVEVFDDDDETEPTPKQLSDAIDADWEEMAG